MADALISLSSSTSSNSSLVGDDGDIKQEQQASNLIEEKLNILSVLSPKSSNNGDPSEEEGENPGQMVENDGDLSINEGVVEKEGGISEERENPCDKVEEQEVEVEIKDGELEEEKEKNGFDCNDYNYSYNDNDNDGVNSDDNNGNKEEDESKRRRYPVREEAEDCAFYVKTGMCKFGMNCKFNHPPNTKFPQGGKMRRKEEFVDTAAEKVKGKDDSAEMEGPIDCKYFDRPGGCKFGKSCKFNHNRKAAPTLNFMGLPVRQGEKECPFYMRNGSCKFGASCRFNHPDPTSVGGPDALTGNNNNGGSVSSTSASQSTLSPWSSPAAFNESPAYVPLMFPPTQPVPSQTEWTRYRAPVYPPERSMQMVPTYAMNSQSFERNVYAHQQEQVYVDEFPERPGQPECSFFVKTGTCKYRSACKFHHPKKLIAKSPPCSLSVMGLPLRPGESICNNYNRYGICKYGPACKYDHPVHHPLSVGQGVLAAAPPPSVLNSMINNQAMAAGR